MLTSRVYIAGPITGYVADNRPAFDRLATALRLAGFLVVNPHELHQSCGHRTHAEFMRCCLPALMTCDGIALLPGWRKSRGARLERAVARGLGIVVVPHAELVRARDLAPAASEPVMAPAPA